MKITIIHPSRGRSKLAKQVYDNWMAKAAKPEDIEYIVSIDVSDPDRDKYLTAFFGNSPLLLLIPAPDSMVFSLDNVKVREGHNSTAVEAINNAAKEATGDLLIVVSDDFECPQNWDMELLKYLKGKSDFLVKTADGLQPWLITLPIMDRVYYERFGYIYNPEYKHMFCDTEMTCVGDLLSKTIIVPLIFPHHHYSQPGGIHKDTVSEKNDSTWGQGENLFLDRMKRNFDLTDITGCLRADKNHLKWFESKGIKQP